MNKILLTIDLSKVKKDRIVDRTYKDKDGNELVSKDYKMEAIELDEPKVIKEGDTWRLVKTHFLVQAKTKEEREAKVKTVFLGDGLQFEDLTNQSNDLTSDEIPF